MKKNFIYKVVIISLITNIILTVAKLAFGYLGNSVSLISDGYNSLIDIFVSVLILVALTISNKTPDKNHPYGHEKYEGVAYLILSMLILFTGGFILFEGLSNLVEYLNGSLIIKPEIYTVYIALFAVVIKLFLYLLNYVTAKKYQSNVLKADSKNHLVDILSTSASLVSLILASYNILYFEPVATIIISIFIFYTSIDLMKEAISFLVDEAPSKKVMKSIKQTILDCKGVVRVDDLKARKHMNHFYVDVEIAVNANLSLLQAHKIAEDVHDTIEITFEAIHCMVHVNPDMQKNTNLNN